MEKENRSTILSQIAQSASVMERLKDDVDNIDEIGRILITAYRHGHKVVLFGNGGSAADAQHIAAELIGGYKIHDRPSLPALALSTNTSSLTAIGNDFSFDDIFSRQVESLVSQGDVVIAISTSGNSKNVVKGAVAAKARKAIVVGLTGASGGVLKKECDYCIHVPTTDTAHIQQAHIMLGHIFCALVENAMVGKSTVDA